MFWHYGNVELVEEAQQLVPKNGAWQQGIKKKVLLHTIAAETEKGIKSFLEC